jgi:hypothetical protein
MRLNSEEIGKLHHEGKLTIKELAIKFRVCERRIEKCLYDYNYRRRIRSNVYLETQNLKQDTDRQFAQQIGAESIADVYAGASTKYTSVCSKVITNDIDQKCPTQYHLPADRFLAQMYGEARNIDLIDLDPYGSCWDCLPMAIKLARKGLIISYGDFSNWRYKRWEIIQYQVGCIPKNLDEYKADLIGITIQMGMSYAKKKLVPLYAFTPNKYFTRIYYKVEKGKWNINNGAEKLRKKETPRGK